MGLVRVCAIAAAALLRDREGNVRGAAGTGQRGDEGAAGRVGHDGVQAQADNGGGVGGRGSRSRGVPEVVDEKQTSQSSVL
jgi:hypothetical protein